MSASEDDCSSSIAATVATVATAGVGPGRDEKQDEVAFGHRVECAVCNVRNDSESLILNTVQNQLKVKTCSTS